MTQVHSDVNKIYFRIQVVLFESCSRALLLGVVGQQRLRSTIVANTASVLEFLSFDFSWNSTFEVEGGKKMSLILNAHCSVFNCLVYTMNHIADASLSEVHYFLIHQNHSKLPYDY